MRLLLDIVKFDIAPTALPAVLPLIPTAQQERLGDKRW
jgi:hypothetical protein